MDMENGILPQNVGSIYWIGVFIAGWLSSEKSRNSSVSS